MLVYQRVLPTTLWKSNIAMDNPPVSSMVFLIQFSSTVDIQACHVSWHHSNIVLPIFIHKYPASITIKNHIYLYQNHILRTRKNQICSETSISEPIISEPYIILFLNQIMSETPKKQTHPKTSSPAISKLQGFHIFPMRHLHLLLRRLPRFRQRGQLQGRAQHQVHWLPERQKTQGAAVHGDAHA